MPVSTGAVDSETVSGRAWMDVRKGRVWTGARVPVELSLRDGALVLRVATTRLGKKERSALVRLCGDQVLSTLIAKREEPEIVLAPGETTFAYPSFPGVRSQIRVNVRDRPPAVLIFIDPAEAGDPMANPFGFTMRLMRAGPAARRVRDEWKARIESAAAP